MKLDKRSLSLFLLLSLFSFSVADHPGLNYDRTVTLDGRGLLLDGKYFPLVSGEFHYWRHNPIYWKKILQTMKDANLEIISTYIPWSFHELGIGTFDFDGRTNEARNLNEFLKLCQDMGFKVIVRPGPFIAAEVTGGGLPEDLTNVDHLDPRFLERSKPWIAAVCSVLAPRQYTRGGPVILYQIENEIFFPLWTKPSAPYGEAGKSYTYDVGLVMGKYQQWLEKKYGTIQKLNEALRVRYKRFDEVQPPDFKTDSLAMSLKSWEFISDAIMDYFEKLKREFVLGGMEVPSYANIGQFVVFYDYQRLEKIVNSVGLDLYMFNMLPGDEALVVNWYNRLFAARQRFPWSPEFQCGIWRGWSDQTGFITGKHQEYITLLSLATGLRGFNYYMFVNRDRWSYAAVDEVGEPESDGKFSIMKSDIALAKQLTRDTHLARVGLVWSLPHNQKFLIDTYQDWQDAGRYFLDRQGPKETPIWWSTFKELSRLDADFDLVILPGGDLKKYSAVVYAGPDFIDEQSYTEVDQYLKQGGKLLVTSQVPTMNLEQRSPSPVRQLSSSISQSKGTRLTALRALGSQLTELNVLQFVKTNGNGVISSLNKADDGSYTLFVANTTDSTAVVNYVIAPGVLDPERKYVRKDLLSGESKSGSSADLTNSSVDLEAKQVVVYTLRSLP